MKCTGTLTLLSEDVVAPTPSQCFIGPFYLKPQRRSIDSIVK
jgi:hypothetical protein